MTNKLYYQDSHLQIFQSRVTQCTPFDGGYQIVLDQTAFFPTGGGQAADRGTLNEVPVLDVREAEDAVIHCTDVPIPVGTEVSGRIDWDTRFQRMQQHTGEHIVSGQINKLYGYDNAGFHMGGHTVTLDFSGVLTWEEAKQIEHLANVGVMKNIAVSTGFPTPEELDRMQYRSKLDLTENVRIVSIEGYDTCACCALHVSFTGEIGLIKLLDCTPHRGGVRINMICGYRALEDYCSKFEQVAEISRMLSSKQDEVAAAVGKLQRQLVEARDKAFLMGRNYAMAKVEGLAFTFGNILLFEPDLDSLILREMVNVGLGRCEGICAAFAGEDGNYRYVLGSRSQNLQVIGKDFNRALNGRGGGTAEMIQGSVSCTRVEIEAFF